MPSSGRFSTSIVVNNEPLEEYAVAERDNVHSCWIASQEGINFHVSCDSGPSNEAWAAYVYVDGYYMDSRVYEPKGIESGGAIRGCPKNANEMSLFAFSKVLLTDDENVAAVDRQLPGLGTIEVRIRRVAVTSRNNILNYGEPDLSNTSVIHERSKKMGMHRVVFQGTALNQVKSSVSVRNLDVVPTATFIFRYRPKAFLCAQGIIPITNEENNVEPPSSSTGGVQGDVVRQQERKRKRREQDATGGNDVIDINSDEEAEEVRKLKQQMLDARSRLKDLERRKSARVKKEPKCEPVASMSLLVDANGVIDLSED
ncbi:hypothetical protein SCHPADRAFT_905445 [Schizopora paradoxa]|uniref:DUF7918 domain-containing protein n=1 Tax=Schizopora paradoxa TaxID=27342 RepID=A0A0H2RJP8_9AGAM|nr:hypothetical protein SCHPADRAFT_905445 [Schizopora paradoxa]